MRYLLLLLLVVGIAGYVLPGQREGTATPCAALEVRVRSLVDAELTKLPQPGTPAGQAAMAQAKGQLPTGATIEAMARERMPMLPPAASCVVAYWATVYQSDLRQVLPGLTGHP